MVRHRLEQEIARAWPVERWRDVRVLVAVSGGADSVALLRGLVALADRPELLFVGHFNHGWRGAESDADAAWVAQLAKQLGLECRVGRPQGGVGSESEESARKARYDFLVRTAYEIGARYVATAHTADDRVETMLHNMMRGSGLRGLISLAPARPLDEDLVLVRPLWRVTRRMVEDYLQELGQSFRQDQTNRDVRFARNFWRNEVLPMLRDRYGTGLDRRLLDLADDLSDLKAMLDGRVDEYLAEVERLMESPPHKTTLQRMAELTRLGTQAPQNHSLSPRSRAGRRTPLSIPTAGLLPAPWAVVREAVWRLWEQAGWPLKDMDRRHWNRIREAWSEQAEDGQDLQRLATLPNSLQLVRIGRWLGIVPPPR